MLFKKLENKKVYETWKYKSKNIGLVVYILRMPEDFKNNEYFHFQISSAKSKKCYIRYDSIYDLGIYPTLEVATQAVKKWWHENIKRII